MTTSTQLVEIEANEEVQQMFARALTVQDRAQAIVTVGDDDTDLAAKTVMGEIKAELDAHERARKFLTQPLYDHMRAINDQFKAKTDPLTREQSRLKSLCGRFFMDKQEAARREQEALRRKQEAEAKRAAARAEKKGVAAPPPPPPAIVQTPEKTTRTDAGSASVRKVWRFEVIDESQVPREYLVVDEKKIRAVVKAGVRSIPGVRIYEDVDVAVRS
jgi:cell fate (sporulation/competence/biofilm development) regulator YlbF (YheA/YmcA/DUF963 family)